MKNQQDKLLLNEWLSKAEHDLGSAELLLKDFDYYDIVVYHGVLKTRGIP